MNAMDKYLDMSNEDIDNLLIGINLQNNENKYSDKDKCCINCKSYNLVIDNTKGHMVCIDCAMINEEYFDEKPDAINNDTENSRYGTPSNFFYPIASLGTKIVAKGYNRLSLLQRQGQMPYKEKSLMDVLEISIQDKCKKYGIKQPIIDTAKIFYKIISESVHLDGKRKGKNIIMRCVNRRAIIAACLFHACKLESETRSPKEIADIYDLEIKHFNKGHSKFNEICETHKIFSIIKSSQAFDFIERYCKILNIDKKYIDISKDVAMNINKLNIPKLSKHEPPSIAAGCILLVCQYYNIPILKKNISMICGSLSNVTISHTVRKIYPYHKIVLNNKITELIVQKKDEIANNSSSSSESNNSSINNDLFADLSQILLNK
jgi:transcription initiation factor TFIIIB Brf1 subunit/transcription initiation factor TFIIB